MKKFLLFFVFVIFCEFLSSQEKILPFAEVELIPDYSISLKGSVIVGSDRQNSGISKVSEKIIVKDKEILSFVQVIKYQEGESVNTFSRKYTTTYNSVLENAMHALSYQIIIGNKDSSMTYTFAPINEETGYYAYSFYDTVLKETVIVTGKYRILIQSTT